MDGACDFLLRLGCSSLRAGCSLIAAVFDPDVAIGCAAAFSRAGAGNSIWTLAFIYVMSSSCEFMGVFPNFKCAAVGKCCGCRNFKLCVRASEWANSFVSTFRWKSALLPRIVVIAQQASSRNYCLERALPTHQALAGLIVSFPAEWRLTVSAQVVRPSR